MQFAFSVAMLALSGVALGVSLVALFQTSQWRWPKRISSIRFPVALTLSAMAFAIALGLFFGTGTWRMALSSAGIELKDDKPGWMDDAAFTEADRARVAEITGRNYASMADVIRAQQSRVHGDLTRRDFELLRQDRRRARAAYPEVKPDDLTAGGWFNVDLSSRIPDSYCTSHNSNGTQGPDGKWYLDGGCYAAYVRSEYPNRAGAAETKTFFADLKAKERSARLERLNKEGPFAWWSGTGGSLNVKLDRESGEVVIIKAEDAQRTGTRWRMPFVADEWADISESDIDQIKKLPSFAKAREDRVEVVPSGMIPTWTTTSTGRPFDGTLMPGESVSVGIPLPAGH